MVMGLRGAIIPVGTLLTSPLPQTDATRLKSCDSLADIGERLRKSISSRLDHSTLRGLASLVSGATGGQLIVVAMSPLLTRMYSPQSFGAFSFVISLSAIVITVATLKFDTAIPLSDGEDEPQRLVRLAILSAAIVSLLASALIGVFSTVLTEVAGFEVLPWAWWIPPIVLLTSAFVALSQAALRLRDYTAIAKRSLIQNAGTALAQLCFGWFSPSAAGLLSGQLFGRTVGLLPLARSVGPILVKPGHASTYRAVVRKYWRFPLVFAPSAALNMLGTQLPLIFVGLWYGVNDAGYLGIAQRVVLIPAALIGTAVAQVFSAELSARLRAGKLNSRRLYLRASARLAIFGSVVGAAIIAVSPTVFPLLLGVEWRASGAFAQATGLSVGIGLIVGPLSFVFVAYQQTCWSILVDLTRIILVSSLGLVAHLSDCSVLAAVWLMYFGQAVNYFFTWIVGLKIVSVSTKAVAHDD